MSVNQPSSEWHLQTVGGIPVKMVSRTISFGEEDASAVEVVIIRANRLAAFVAESFPVPYMSLGSLIYPRRRYFPGLPSLIARQIRCEGLVDGVPIDPFDSDLTAPTGTYQKNVRVTLEYSTSSSNSVAANQNNPRTFLEVSSNTGGEFLTSPVRGSAVWYTPGYPNEEVKEVDALAVQMQPETEWSVRWSQIPHDYFSGVLLGRMRAALGTVNSAAMALCYDAPAETVLFLGYAMQQQYTWRTGYSGRPPVQLEMRFLEKNLRAYDWRSATITQVTHNHIYRPGLGYERVLIDGQPLYQQANLNLIFLPTS